MANDFLENLKKAVDNGEFNSEAAKKIIEVDKNADDAKGLFLTEEEKEQVKKLHADSGVTEEAVVEANVNYEIEMAVMKRKDEINRLLVTLIEIEDMVKMSVEDMFLHINELNSKFEKEFKNEDPLYADLSQKMQEITLKYGNIINH
jgi:hypothetical protein